MEERGFQIDNKGLCILCVCEFLFPIFSLGLGGCFGLDWLLGCKWFET